MDLEVDWQESLKVEIWRISKWLHENSHWAYANLSIYLNENLGVTMMIIEGKDPSLLSVLQNI